MINLKKMSLILATTLMTFSTANATNLIKLNELSPVSQLHGDPYNSELRIFMAGNQFVLMDLLVEQFKKENPDIPNVFYVTLPPGTELKTILKGGFEFKSDKSLDKEGLILRIKPDVYSTINIGHLKKLEEKGLADKYQIYAHNRLTIMASKNDELANKSIDTKEFYELFSNENEKISEPDISNQGIERHIWKMYNEATRVVFPGIKLDDKMIKPSGLENDPENSLRKIVYNDKSKNGGTKISTIAHHLETPAWIKDGSVRFGPVWKTEGVFAIDRLKDDKLSLIEINGKDSKGDYLDRRNKVNYMATAIKTGNDERTARAERFIKFLNSDSAQEIYKKAGFIPSSEMEKSTILNIK